jgi:hypothetical protein
MTDMTRRDFLNYSTTGLAYVRLNGLAGKVSAET